MPFEPEKDKVVIKWRCEQTGLVISINQYDNGEPKLQIGPRVVIKKDGGEAQRKSGRLTIEDVMWIYDVIDEVKDELSKLVGPR